MSLLQKIAKYTSLLNKPVEAYYIKKFSSKKPKHQPVFIVGAPRSGSTIFYQLLTNTFDVLYTDNLVELFHRNFYLGFCLSHLLFKDKPHNCFSSELGQTRECGLHAPSESGAFWYRWLPKDKHYCTRNDITEKAIIDIRNNINSVINRFQKPFIFKNLNAGQRLDLINVIVPEAKVIFIKRNPLFTAQSIYMAKRKLKIETDTWWSVKPKNYLELEKLPAVEQIVKQVFFLEKQIFEDSKLFDNSNFITIDYSEISSRGNNISQEIKSFIGEEINEREDSIFPEIKISDEKKTQDDIFENFKLEIEKYDWDKYEIK